MKRYCLKGYRIVICIVVMILVCLVMLDQERDFKNLKLPKNNINNSPDSPFNPSLSQIFSYRSVEKLEVTQPLPEQKVKYVGNVLNTEVIENREIVHTKTSNTTCLKTKEEYNKNYEKLHMNIPVNLLRKRKIYFDDNGCAIFPVLRQLQFNNIFWQTLNLKMNGTAYFLNAYYDNRDLVVNRPVVRILSFIRLVDISLIKYCQIWFPNERNGIIANVSSAIFMDPWENDFHTYILSCEIPSKYQNIVPAAVSLVENECDPATNVLTVHYNLPETGKKEDFAICIKALSYPEQDISHYLVQYVELAKLLGVHKIFIYEYAINPNISAVLRYYEKQDRLHVTPITIPGTWPNIPALQHDVLRSGFFESLYQRVPHNDCFYRNMYKYKYIAFFDRDEIMIPMNGKSWKEVINEIIHNEKYRQGDAYKPPTSYLAQAALFLDQLRDDWEPDIPRYMSMLQNVYRADNFFHTKQLVDTEQNLGISNHKPLRCIGECRTHTLNHSKVILAHYRNACLLTTGKKCIGHKDTMIWNHKEAMIKEVDKALKNIGLL